jgi:hypothetical protein
MDKNEKAMVHAANATDLRNILDPPNAALFEQAAEK